MKIIDKISAKCHLSESGQGSIEMKFALLNKEIGEIITPFCKCKDYFSDAFWAKYTRKNVVNMYGFSFGMDEDKGLFDKDEISLAIRMVSRDTQIMNTVFQENLDNIISLLNKLESANNFNLCIGEICEENKHFIITFDKRWTEIPYLLSGFFMFLRLGFHYDRESKIKDYYSKPEKFITPNDQMYLKSTIDVVDDIENGYLDRSQKYSDYLNQSITHNSSGIVGYRTKYKKREVSEAVTVN